MRTIKLCIAVFTALVLTGGTLFASSLAIQINQIDDSRENVSDASLMFEGYLLNGLYDMGFIVSNFPAAIVGNSSNGKSSGDQTFSSLFADADTGMVDYVAAVILVYESDANVVKTANQNERIKSVEWKLYRVSEWKAIGAGTIVGASLVGSNEKSSKKNDDKNMQENVRKLIAEIQHALE